MGDGEGRLLRDVSAVEVGRSWCRCWGCQASGESWAEPRTPAEQWLSVKSSKGTSAVPWADSEGQSRPAGLHSHLPAQHIPSNRESPQQQTCPRCQLGHSGSFPSAVGAVLWQQGKGCHWDFLRMVVSPTGDYLQLLSWCILNRRPSPLPGKLYLFKHLACRWGNIAHALLWRQLNSASRTSGKSLNYCHLTGALFSILLFTEHPYNLKMDNVPARIHLAKELFLFCSALALAQAGTAAKPGSSCHPKFKTDLLSGSIHTSFS